MHSHEHAFWVMNIMNMFICCLDAMFRCLGYVGCQYLVTMPMVSTMFV